MNNTEFINIIEYLERDRGVDREILIEAIESAILSAFKKSKKLDFSDLEDVKVHVDRNTGNIDVFAGEEKVTPKDFGRIAAQTAKQVIMQKMKEAETTVLFDNFKEKQGELINGVIRRFEGSNIILEVGKIEAILPKKEQVTRDDYRVHDRLRAYVLDISRSQTNIRMIISRSHPNLVKKLFEFEVPEIYENVVEIKSLAREPGERTKISVYSESSKIDSVGACVGIKGSRVKNIVNELRGEKIDIVRWDNDPSQFIKNALSPAEINRIIINEEEKVCEVIVPENQLSLAIGKKGQNARLAAKLTGWNIDIHTGKKENVPEIVSLFKSEESAENMENKMKEAVSLLSELPEVNVDLARELVQSGFITIEQLAQAEMADLIDVEGIDEELASRIIESARSKRGDSV